MADNVAITAGSGTNIATDDAGAGGHVQIVKLAIGTDGSATVIPADSSGLLVNSELPAAAALTDTVANPTTPTVGGAMLVWNGSTWERVASFDSNNQTVGQLAVVSHTDAGGGISRPDRPAGTATDADAGTNFSPSGTMVFNGSSWDRIRGDITNGLDVDVTRMPKAATATTSQVADTASSATLLASNAGRLGATITNDSSARLYVRLGAAVASTTNYSFSLAQHETWEPTDSIMFTGEIRGIWATDPGDGGAKVTELTA